MYTIFGATGNIGSKIVEIILGKGEKVRAVARTADRLAPLAVRGAEVHVGDLHDTSFLTRVLKGSKAVFTLIPPHYHAENFSAYQDEIGESIAHAVRSAGIPHVVNLSSGGAELPAGNGPIAGLYRMEQRLNAIPHLNVLHLRPAYFMENLLMNIPLVKSKGIMGSAIRGDLLMPMIATRDIAAVAANHLIKHTFTGSSVLDLLGERDLKLNEVAGIIGKRIGIPGLAYVRFPYEDAEKGLLAAGLSQDMSRLYIEMSKGFNEGKVGSGIKRTRENTTPTTIEEFADVFANLYGGQRAA